MAQPSGYVYVNPEPVSEMVVPYLYDTIIIDGIADSGYPTPVSLQNILTFTAGEFMNTADHSVTFQMGWRDEGMYLFFDIKDDIDKGSVLDWGLDGVELKINPDLTNDGEYFEWKDDAIEIGFVRDITTEYRYHIVDIDGEGTEGNGPAENGEIVINGPRAGLPGITFEIINNTGAYTVEALIPWMFFLPLGTLESDIPVWIEKEMGFDIHCHDNDVSLDNSGRDHSLIWDTDGDPVSTDADKANKNTSLLGSITFGEKTNNIPISRNNRSLLYPNPSSGYLQMNLPTDVEHIEFINILGQSKLQVDIKSELTLLDVSELISGIYLVKGSSASEVVFIEKLIIK